MSIFSVVPHIFSAIPIKTPSSSQRKIVLKVIWKHTRPHIAKATLRGRRNAREITIPDFKFYSRVIIIKTAWHLCKEAHFGPCNRRP